MTYFLVFIAGIVLGFALSIIGILFFEEEED